MSKDGDIISDLKELISLINSDKFDKTNSHRAASRIPENCFKGPCILGVDEAGRGPVLGPMVYSICYCPADKVEILKTIGCVDSKALTESKREDIFALINSNNDCLGWAVDIISPNLISNKMLQKAKYSLNEIAQNSTIKLVESILEKNIDISEIFVDTIGPPEKYQAKLSKLFPKCKITVEAKADSLYPIVGAASICAKVVRDSVVQNWKFPELIDAPEKNDFGTGYPGDPKTKQFLTDNADNVFGFPNLVRFSWSTANKFLSNCVKVEWEDENELKDSKQQSISKFFSHLSSSGEEKHKPLCCFFKERSLSNVDNF